MFFFFFGSMFFLCPYGIVLVVFSLWLGIHGEKAWIQGVAATTHSSYGRRRARTIDD